MNLLYLILFNFSKHLVNLFFYCLIFNYRLRRKLMDTFPLKENEGEIRELPSISLEKENKEFQESNNGENDDEDLERVKELLYFINNIYLYILFFNMYYYILYLFYILVSSYSLERYGNKSTHSFISFHCLSS